jgi:hypothetical protein
MPSKRNQHRTRVGVVAKAVCELPDGERRTLYATELTPSCAHVLSLDPPPLQTMISLTLYPRRGQPVPPIAGRVIWTRLDPSDAAGSGFGLAFTDISGTARQALAIALQSLGLASHPPAAPGVERRVHPRVWLDVGLRARVATGTVTRVAMVLNLSLTSALLAFADSEDLSELQPGTPLSLDIVMEAGPEVASVDARVVRQTGDGEPRGLGVEFVGLDRLACARIEGLIVCQLGDNDDSFED